MKHSEKKQTILAVDDTPENLDILKGILTPEYKVKAAINGKMALKIAQTQETSLILLDIMMPEMDGYEVCQMLKANPKTNTIPVIFVTAMSETSDEKKGFSVGAVDYITKPVNPSIVHARVRTHLALADQQRTCEMKVEKRTRELIASQRAAIFMLGEAGHYNDSDTGVHIWRMAAYAAALARAAGWSVKEAELLELAAPMHDSGKIGISDTLLKAPRKLTPEEFEEMKQHTLIGEKILSLSSDSPVFKMALNVAVGHHEKWDGSGYPKGISGEDIPESARIAAVADVFDALTMKRPYKEPWPTERAFQVIEQDSGTHFDPKLAARFLEIKDEILEIREKWGTKE
ncbi:MAG: response regulator [Magnetococcales bacterium]|nr:response regulator [Magnetococcales bacterium]